MSSTPPKIADITPEILESWADQLSQGVPLHDVFIAHRSACGAYAIDTLRWFVAHHDAGNDRISRMVELDHEARAPIEAGEEAGELVSGLIAAANTLKSRRG